MASKEPIENPNTPNVNFTGFQKHLREIIKDIRQIVIKKVPPKLRIGGDSALAEFFMRLNSRECRILFMHHLSVLKIPIRTSHLPRLRIWVNGANYKLPITPKFQQNYLN